MASSVASSSLNSGTRSPRLLPPKAVLRRPRGEGSASPPSYLYQWAWGLRGPRKTSLAHSAVCGLPLEVHPTEFLALLDEFLSDEVQHAKLNPPLESPVYRGVVGKLSCGQSVPLAAASHPKDDRIQSGTLVHARAAGALRRIMLL